MAKKSASWQILFFVAISAAIVFITYNFKPNPYYISTNRVNALLGTNVFSISSYNPHLSIDYYGNDFHESVLSFVNIRNDSNYSLPAAIVISATVFQNNTEASEYLNLSRNPYNNDLKENSYDLATSDGNVFAYNIYSVAAPNSLIHNYGTYYANFKMPIFQYTAITSDKNVLLIVTSVGFTSTLDRNASIDILKYILNETS